RAVPRAEGLADGLLGRPAEPAHGGLVEDVRVEGVRRDVPRERAPGDELEAEGLDVVGVGGDGPEAGTRLAVGVVGAVLPGPVVAAVGAGAARQAAGLRDAEDAGVLPQPR